MIRRNRTLPAVFFVGIAMTLLLAEPVGAIGSLYSYLTGAGSGIVTLGKGQVEFQSYSTDLIKDYTQLYAKVDYAIFAPGTYSSAGLNFSPYSSSSSLSDTDYVYAYQLHNLPQQAGQPKNVDIYVGIIMPHFSVEGYNFGYSDPVPNVETPTPIFSGDVKPSLIVVGTAIVYSFLSEDLQVGESSYVLLIASPYSPDIFPVTVMNHSLTDQQDMPVPAVVVPIPGAMALAAMGMGTIFVGRLRRRF